MHEYGFDEKVVTFMTVNLNNRSQRTKIGSYFSDSADILSGVLQGSAAGPLLF